MTTARQKILGHLKKTRTASAREIARALKMTAPNVRHHLGVLLSDNRVEMVSVQRKRGGKGRPEKVYSLSGAALGDNLPMLVDTLLDETVDPKAVGERIARSLGLADFANLPVAKRLALLVERLNEMHYQPRWEAGPDGPRVIFGRCPYARVINNHPELCRMDAALLKTILGWPVTQIAKIETVVYGDCPYIHLIG